MVYEFTKKPTHVSARFIFQLNYLAKVFHEIVYNWAILGLCITLIYLRTFAWRGRQKSQASSYMWEKIRRFS
jgi:hypothetical protein